MKLNELTAGDWVLCNGHPLQLNAAQLYNLAMCTHWASIHRIEPLEITEEMLVKNGYVEAFCDDLAWNDSQIRYFRKVRRFHLCSSNLGKKGLAEWLEDVTDVSGRFDFVHQLQNAMRLCGMDEDADKFMAI